MRGKAVCRIDSLPPENLEFENVVLTYVSRESMVILSRENGDEPEELLVMESATVDILSRTEIDLEGFICPNEGDKRFFRCRLKFRV
jgi:hypothetical protein